MRLLQALHGRRIGVPLSKRDVYLYGIHGQSNAGGNSLNSNLVAPYNTVIPNCYTYYKAGVNQNSSDGTVSPDNGSFQPLSTSVNNTADWMANGWYGPELRFGYEMQAYHNRPIFLIKYAIGDTALNSENTSGVAGAGGLLDWDKNSPGELYNRAVTYYWLRAMRDLRAMGYNPIPKSILWMQGERDCFFSSFATAYAANLRNLISNFRADLGAPSLQFCVGRISSAVRDARTYGTTVYSAQTTVGAETNNALLNTDPYALQGDNVHFADHGELGYDYYLAARNQ